MSIIKFMIIQDTVYGKIKINEPIILDLINSRALQRLKKIDQAGYFQPHFPGSKHTRYEHSVGVYFLLKKYNASLEEQIAGLIHDVSHLAFSHCADYVLNQAGTHKQDLQDSIFNEFVKNSEIPKILQKYDFDLEYILNEKNFPLLETDLPDLCADRIDYSLRSAVHYLNYSSAQINNILNKLKVIDNRWVFEDENSAKEFAELFDQLNQKYYCGIPSAKMFYTLSEYLLYALQHDYLQIKDLYEDDEFVLEKLKNFHKQDKELEKLFEILNNPNLIEADEKDYKREILCKSRIVDPLLLKNEKIIRLSQIDEVWLKRIEQEKLPKKYYLRNKG